MTEREPSKTALGVAVLRAAHMLIDTSPKILDDPVVLKLLESTIISEIQPHADRFQLPASLALRSHVLIRSRYAEDRLAQAVERGIRQFVSLGAGYDTFAYRQPEWAHDLGIFEVDQPASQQAKRERLQAAGIPIPSNVEFVPIDFETTSLEAGMSASSFDPTHSTFLSWLGVMVYLTRDAADAVFKYAVSLPHSSEIVLTFSPPRPNGATGNRTFPTIAERAAALGEPWETHISADELSQHLYTLGFSQVTIPTPEEISAWYIGSRQDGLRASPRRTIASAVV